MKAYQGDPSCRRNSSRSGIKRTCVERQRPLDRRGAQERERPSVSAADFPRQEEYEVIRQ